MSEDSLKFCSICNKYLPLSEFYAKQSACKECVKQRQREYNQKHRDYINQRQQQYNNTHKEQAKQYRKEYKQRLNEQSRKYYITHSDKILEQKATKKEQKAQYDREYYYTVKRPVRPVYKNLTPSQRYYENQLSNCLSSGIRKALKQNKANQHWEDLVPYTLQELKEHLKRQFTSEMSWGNYGSYWEIDHIIPQNLFNLSNTHDFQICWSLMNLRPLEKSANRKRPKDGSDVLEKLKQQILGQSIDYGKIKSRIMKKESI